MWVVVLLAAVAICQAEPSVKLRRQNLVNKRPTSGFIDIKERRSVLECAKSCSQRSDCVSLFYTYGTRECQRHEALYTAYSLGLVGEPSTVYWEKEDTSTSTSTSSSTSTTTLSATATSTMTTTSTEPPCFPTAFACPPTAAITYTNVVLPGCYEAFGFRIFTDRARTFGESKEKCHSANGKLVEILTLDKMGYMLNLTTCADYTPLDYWIDGLYNAATSTWETTGGTPLPMSQGDFWDTGRPNAPDPTGHCVWVRTHHGYHFDDFPCEGEKMPRTICEFIY